MFSNLFMYINNIPGDSKLIYALEILRQKIRTKLDSFFEPYGIDVFKFNFLMVLKSEYGRNTVTAENIKESLLIVPEYIKKMGDELLLDGLINISEENGKNILEITPKGLKLIDEVYDKYQALNSQIANVISEKDKDILQEKLLNWFVNIQQTEK